MLIALAFRLWQLVPHFANMSKTFIFRTRIFGIVKRKPFLTRSDKQAKIESNATNLCFKQQAFVQQLLKFPVVCVSLDELDELSDLARVAYSLF